MTYPASAESPTILEQLNAAWRAKGWTLTDLVERADLPGDGGKRMERTTLGKKLRGELPMKAPEIERLAIVLEVTVTYPLPPAEATVDATQQPSTEDAA